MTVKRRMLDNFTKLSMPVSYKLLARNKLYDARNIFDNKDVTDTRNGIKKYNSTSLSGRVLSVSYFKPSSGTRYKIVKIGTILYSVAASGAHTSLKTGLTETTKHRGTTLGDRHIIALEDALYSFNGTTFTQLGQSPPSAVTALIGAGGALVVTTTYQPAITFYASSIGFESNAQTGSNVVTAGANLRCSLTDIPTTADNALIDKVRIYIKNVTTNSAMLFVAEIDLGTATYDIDAVPTSTQIPPTTHATPIAGGGKYLTAFGKCVAYTGNGTYKNDVLISEDYLPDAYDDTSTAKTLEIPGQGEVTGIAAALYNESYLDPYLVIFKKTTTVIYSELNGLKVQTTLDEHIGCISHDTIKVRKGIVCFMSENGWYFIENGIISKSTLGDGDIDDIFSREGWAYQLNVSQYANFFSSYYSTLGHYLTFVAEGGNDSFYKAYNYEERIKGFRVYSFKTPLTCACEGEDDDGNQCVFLGDLDGFLYTLSVKNEKHDENALDEEETIPAFAYLPFTLPGDNSTSYNFRTLVVTAINSSDAITVRPFAAYSLFAGDSTAFDFSNSSTGFILDNSQLDIDVLGDERVPVTYKTDVNKTGETMVIGFFQDILDANMGLISSQLYYNKNGNSNL